VLRANPFQRPENSLLSLTNREARTLVRVSWENSEQADYFHGFVSGYAKAVFSASTAERVILASQELLENALHYSLMSKEIAFELCVTANEARVSVQNTTISSRIEMLRAHLTRIQEDPERTYTTELERSMSGGGRRAMLGLVRICHEANMVLGASVDGGDVTVTASCRR
jgi:hypothetical protein